jgi:hypothetical protein
MLSALYIQCGISSQASQQTASVRSPAASSVRCNKRSRISVKKTEEMQQEVESLRTSTNELTRKMKFFFSSSEEHFSEIPSEEHILNIIFCAKDDQSELTS